MTTLPSTVSERVALPAGVSARGGEGSAGLTAGDILSILRRRMVLIAVLFTLFSAMVVGGFVVWWVYFPSYQATAFIECVTNVPEAQLEVAPERLRDDEFERFVATQAARIVHPAILREALALKEVQETDYYKSIPTGEHLTELTDDLVAAPQRGTNFLKVSIACRKLTDPKIIVNSVVDRWYNKVTEDAAQAYAPQLTRARDDLDALDKQIEQKRSRLQSIAEGLPAGANLEGALNITAQEVLQYGEQSSMLQLERDLLEQYKEVYDDPTTAPVTQEDRRAVEASPEIAQLTQQLLLLQQQREADAPTFGEEHPEMRALDGRIAATRAELDRFRTQRLNERRAEIRELTNTAYQSTSYALHLAMNRLSKAEGALIDQDRMLFDYENLKAEIDQDLEYRQELFTYAEQLERVIYSRTAMKVNIAQHAIDPLERSEPSLLMLPLGVFFAMLLAIGLAVAMELLDTSVRTSQDVVRYLDVALLGAVPHVDDEEIAIDQPESAVRDAPRSMMAEAFRQIRTNLQFSAPAAQQRSVLISSPHPEDGKTTVACNLAMAVAQAGRRVLLVDANFRRPAVAKVFGLAPGRGLSNVLVGDSAMADCVQPSGQDHLDILATGPIPPNPAELLGSEQFRAFLDDATARYDQVLIDAPPILLASDPLVIATAMDGVILVVRAKENSRGAARRAVGERPAVRCWGR